MYICTYVYYMILLYLEGSGSKFHSVNTKTSQFCLFFWIPGVEKKYVNTKTSQFSPFLDSRSWENTCVYIYIICIYVHMYICTYVYYMILLYLEDSGSKFHSVNTKTSQFSSFFGFQELRKTCVYIICIYVHMYITWFCYIWRVVVLSFIPSTPKLVNFLHFLDSRNLRKNMSTPKLGNFPPFFGFQELRKNTHIYIYKYVYMYICILHDFAIFGW